MHNHRKVTIVVFARCRKVETVCSNFVFLLLVNIAHARGHIRG